jgi:protein gp37
MGENSGISWCHHTLNWWMGCTKVSAGCKHCYAETLVTTRMRLPVWGDKAERKATSASTRKQVHTWNRKAREAGERHRVFCSSLSDVFEDRPDLAPMRAELFAAIVACPDLDFLLLTKRPENMVRLARDAGWSGAWPSNVWAGCTVENQAMFRERVPHLLEVPASVRFLSCEPLLESIDLTLVQAGAYGVNPLHDIGWVIVGGESGPGARPFDLEWARQIRHQCNAAGTAFFFKQLGARPTTRLERDEVWPGHSFGQGPVQFDGDGFGNYSVRGIKDRAGADPAEWPLDLRVQAFPTR